LGSELDTTCQHTSKKKQEIQNKKWREGEKSGSTFSKFSFFFNYAFCGTKSISLQSTWSGGNSRASMDGVLRVATTIRQVGFVGL
jgi:hypothetical protein